MSSSLGSFMSLERLIYRSTAVSVDCATDFDRIVAVSARNNRRCGITGAVTLCDGLYVQVLEGKSARLDPLLAIIAQDPRHKDVHILGRWTVTGRLFPSWSMARADAARADAQLRSWLRSDDYGVTLVGALLTLTDNVPL
jgi:hypothetical protein